jgi:hypothetical protein
MRPITTLLTLLACAAALPAQGKPKAPRVRLHTDGEVHRLERPQHASCWTAPEVYFFAVEGSLKDLPAGHHLVMLVSPVMWDGRQLRYFAQCIPPVVDRRGDFVAIGQVGSEEVPGGGWFAGQGAEVVMVATSERPRAGLSFAAPQDVPGFVAASERRRIRLARPNSFQVTSDCDSAMVSMTPIGVPQLGNWRFGMDVGSSREGQTALFLLGDPTYQEQPLVGGLCALHLGDRPILAAAGSIRAGHWSVRIPVPNSRALRGRMVAMQSVMYDEASAVAWSSAAWLVTPW